MAKRDPRTGRFIKAGVNERFTGGDPLKEEALAGVLCPKCRQEPDFWVRDNQEQRETFWCEKTGKLFMFNGLAEEKIMILTMSREEFVKAMAGAAILARQEQAQLN